MALPNQNPIFGRIGSGSDALFSRLRSEGLLGQGASQASPAGVMSSGMGAPAKGLIPTAPTPDIFSGGLPPGATNPVHAYAPTGLRQAAINAPINPNDPSMRERSMVWGQGDVMAGYDGMNAAGGQRFTLGQVMPAGDNPVNPANPIAPENLQAANPGMPRANSKIAGLLAAFDEDTTTGKYLRAQEASKLPVDIEHLKILTAMDKANDANDIKQQGVDAKAKADDVKTTAAAQKAVDATQGRATTLSQINEQNNAVMTNIDRALSLADHAGPIEGRLVGSPVGGKEVSQLHGLFDSISGNEMMDYIQRLKAANPAGTIGFRVLDTEAKAMANVFASIKNDKVPLERQTPDFVKEQLNNLKFHLRRMNAIANGKDPDATAFKSGKYAVQVNP